MTKLCLATPFLTFIHNVATICSLLAHVKSSRFVVKTTFNRILTLFFMRLICSNYK